MDKAASETNDSYEIGRLRVGGLAQFANRFGNDSGITILRLVSQLLQDKVRDSSIKTFVGFLNSDDFVIAGDDNSIRKMVNDIKAEFTAVLPFIYQSEGYKPMELGIEDVYGAESPKLELQYASIEKDSLIERRTEVLNNKPDKNDIGSYTYEELRHMLGGEENLDITITRNQDGVRLSIGKGGMNKEDEKPR